MEVGTRVWLRTPDSRWGWLPAVITDREELSEAGSCGAVANYRRPGPSAAGVRITVEGERPVSADGRLPPQADRETFPPRSVVLDPASLAAADHPDVKLRNPDDDGDGGLGGVHDLISLPHLHEPAILHALRLRYGDGTIYTSTGPILIAVNPFRGVDGLYSDSAMEAYRRQGEAGAGGSAAALTPGAYKSGSSRAYRGRNNPEADRERREDGRLPPHAYATADGAYRAMRRGVEDARLGGGVSAAPADQSVLVSGESGAGKTVTTKIVLSYLAMLSRIAAGDRTGRDSFGRGSGGDVRVERQVLQSNPVLEAFGNARTLRNDNSSRFGKYIDVSFSESGRLVGARIDTYLLERVRLIHPGSGERNYHVFYQLLSGASRREREELGLDGMGPADFRMMSGTGVIDRRDGVNDGTMHAEMLEAMETIGFSTEQTSSLLRLVSAVLHLGNSSFTSRRLSDARGTSDACTLDRTRSSVTAASLLGVSFEDLSYALTYRAIRAGSEVVHSPLNRRASEKACEALMKAAYGAAFDYIVAVVNENIGRPGMEEEGRASIGVLDIFGFETFEQNNFEQLCINYTNEALQQQFNRYVFKLEQDEYEREGILWKFISFPDNQDVLDLIDRKHTGIIALLDEQCIVPRSTDEKFTRYLYAKCDSHPRFTATSAQRVDYKFSVEHYAGPVEYGTESWLEKNKDQLPASSANLLKASEFKLLNDIQPFVRTEDREGRGSVATKSVGAQFSEQLSQLRSRIDATVPHYIRCLKPNDELKPDTFDPRRIVDQLRCGGVLEAVRVSRAGYPTRYPHELFRNRYYVLGKAEDMRRTPMKRWGRGAVSSSDDGSAVQKLVSKIAFDIWEADHEAMLANLEASCSPLAANRRSGGGSNANYINGHMNLVSVSTAVSPPDQDRKKYNARKRRETGTFYLSGEIARPTNAAEFLSLDFSSRCAVAGLQMGRTKIFLRREAFERIEKLRAQVFGRSASAIQRIVRGVQARKYCRELRSSMMAAATIIQRTYRAYIDRLFYQEMNAVLVPSAVRIQAVVRGSNTRMWYFGTLYSIMRLQALVRGCQARARVAKYIEAMRQPVNSPANSEARDASFEYIGEFEEITPRLASMENQIVPVEVSSEWEQLVSLVNDENWAAIECTLDQYPELAEQVDPVNGEMLLHMMCRHPNVWTLLVDMVLVLYPKALLHKDAIGASPLHHAAAHNNVAALEVVYSAYKEGVNNIDSNGRQPIHVAAEFDAAEAVKFLLANAPEGAYTIVHQPDEESGGGLPLHIACRHHSSISIITSLLAENFSSAKRTDENGDLPLHLLLRNGEAVDQVTVKTVLTCFAAAASRTDKNGDMPLTLAIKSSCSQSVVNYLMLQYPEASKIKDANGRSNLHLAFEHGADDRVMLGLLNRAPELATAVDRESGMMPIEVATEHEHSHFIVHHLLKQDMPIDIKEKIKAKDLSHNFSWNHVVSNTDDMYYPVVSKILQQCTQPQVLALAHVEGPDGRIALSTATPVCKHEMRVMLRLFNTLEVVNQRPAFSNPESDTQIFYALRYDPPKHDNGQWSLLHEDNKKEGDYLDDLDDASHVSGLSRISSRSSSSLKSHCSQMKIEDKLKQIKKEKGQQVIAKLTSRSDVVERELKIRKDYHLSRHYVPAVISVHHTVQHAAYSEAMAEPGYCITMEGADTTAENLMLDMRRGGKSFSTKILKRIGISLLHMHEHGLVHGDFGTHNVGKFGNRWKLLGVGGSKAIGSPTDPKRGFYHPPESVVVENKRAPFGKKEVVAKVVSIESSPTHDIWAYGVVMYEAICGVPLSPYACRGKRVMNANEIAKVGRWDMASLERALRHADPNDHNAMDILSRLLHPDANQRYNTLREALEHPFYDGSSEDRVVRRPRARKNDTSDGRASKNSISEGLKLLDENATNGVPRRKKEKGKDDTSVATSRSMMGKLGKGLKKRLQM